MKRGRKCPWWEEEQEEEEFIAHRIPWWAEAVAVAEEVETAGSL